MTGVRTWLLQYMLTTMSWSLTLEMIQENKTLLAQQWIFTIKRQQKLSNLNTFLNGVKNLHHNNNKNSILQNEKHKILRDFEIQMKIICDTNYNWFAQKSPQMLG